MIATHYRWQGANLVLNCHVQANAKHSHFCGLHGERVKVGIAAPAIDGQANKALTRFIADAFAVRVSGVTLLRGQSQRHKQFIILCPQQLPPACEIKSTVADCRQPGR